MITCLTCGSEFERHRPSSTTKYCSRACYHAQPHAKRARPFTVRFWEQVEKTESCWNWIGACGRGGYGAIGREFHGKKALTIRAHRASWEIHFGPIPDGMLVCHKCDNPPCVNPSHLFLGTHEDNAKDRSAKGRNYTQCDNRGERGGNARLKESDIFHIRNSYPKISINELAAAYKMHPTHISMIIRRLRWAHVA